MADTTAQQPEQFVEDMIVDKGLTTPRITPQDLDDVVDPTVAVQYHVFPGTTTTVCLLTCKNGYTVTGESTCVDPENFDAEIGREIARRDARNKLWPLLGYTLKTRIASGETTSSPDDYFAANGLA